MKVGGIRPGEVVLGDHDVFAEIMRNRQLLHEPQEGPAVAGGNHIETLVLVRGNQFFAQPWIRHLNEHPIGIHVEEGPFYPSQWLARPVYRNRKRRGGSPGSMRLIALGQTRSQPPRGEAFSFSFLSLHGKPPFWAHE